MGIMVLKYINRILYALGIALGLIFVYNLSDSYARTIELQERGREALESSTYEAFMPTRYYNPTLLFDEIVEDSGVMYQVKIYEVAYIRLLEDELVVVDGIHVLMIQDDGPLQTEFFQVQFVQESATIDYVGYRYFDLPVYSVMNAETATMFARREIFYNPSLVFEPITGFKVYQNEDVLFEIELDLQEDDFVIKEELESYIAIHNDAPSEEDLHYALSPEVIIDTKPIVIRNLSIYIILSSLITYLIFKYRNKKLGRKDPTEALKKDLDRLQ